MNPNRTKYLAYFYSIVNDTDCSIGNESSNIISNTYGHFSADRFPNNLDKKNGKV